MSDYVWLHVLSDSLHLFFFSITLVIFFAGQQTPELPDLWAGPGRFCSADPEPEEHCTWSSAQPCHRHRRFLWRDALCLVQDEIPQYSCWVRDECSCVRASGLISPKITEEYSVVQLNIFRDLWSLHTKEHQRDKRGNYPRFEIQLFFGQSACSVFLFPKFWLQYLLSADKNNKKRNIHLCQQDESYTGYGRLLGGEWAGFRILISGPLVSLPSL